MAPQSGKTTAATGGEATAIAQIDAKIAALSDWRGAALAKVRRLIKAADPSIVEQWKWETPVWSHAGIVCTGEVYKQAVKLTFAKGASLADPAGLFNASLQGNTRRAIDLAEGATLDEAAFAELIRAAASFNEAGQAARLAAKAKKPA